jgi:hypothetical protein
LNTGAATLVGNLTRDGVQQNAATALAYADGTMYTLLNGYQETNLYSVDLASGELTLEFDLGVQMNSLTSPTSLTSPPSKQSPPSPLSPPSPPSGFGTLPTITVLDVEKARVRWRHGVLRVRGKWYLPEGVWKDDLAPEGKAEITLAGINVADQDIEFEVRGKNDRRWRYLDKHNINGHIKKYKIFWKGSKFDYHGDHKFRIHTHFIGEDKTTLCIHTGKISGAFTVTIDETIIAYDEFGNITTSIAYKSRKCGNRHVHFTLPFQLTPDMTIELTGALEETIKVADYFDEAYARFNLVSAFDPGLFHGGRESLPETLELKLTLGDGTNMIDGECLIESWETKTAKRWKNE